MEAQKGHHVRVNYKGTLTDGTQFDSTHGKEPLEFTLGENQVIPGFENGIIGMKEGENKKVEIPVDQAYGEVNNDLYLEVPRSEFPADITPEAGMPIEVKNNQGQVIVTNIASVQEDTVILDANHPLAGRDLIFEIELVKVLKD